MASQASPCTPFPSPNHVFVTTPATCPDCGETLPLVRERTPAEWAQD